MERWYEYRVKPEEPSLQWKDLKVEDVIQKDAVTAMVTMIDSGAVDSRYIHAGSLCLTEEDLKDWRKEE